MLREFSEDAERDREQSGMDIRNVSDIELRVFPTPHLSQGGDALGAHREQYYTESRCSPKIGLS